MNRHGSQENIEDTFEDNFEIIGMDSISDSNNILKTTIRSDHYVENEKPEKPENPKVDSDRSIEPPSILPMDRGVVLAEKELKEKKYVYIESEIEMSGKHNRQGRVVEHKGVNVLIGDPMDDDEVVSKVIAKVNEMQVGVNADEKPVPGGDVLKNPSTVVSGKKIKITQQMIEAAYRKLRAIIKGKKVDAESVAIIVAYALQIANEMLSTSKTYKVELALAIIRKLIDDEVEDPDQKVMLHMLVENTVPSLINTIQGLPGMMSRLFAKCSCYKK